jgi:hypothetical protein
MKKFSVVAVCMLMTALIMSGCSGYRLGSSLPPGIKSVYVPAFKNTSGEPQIDTAATQAALQEFQRDGTLEVADASFADTVLNVTITKFSLEAVRFEADSRKTAKEYRLRLDAEFVFSKSATGEVLQKRKVFGETLFEAAGDLPSAKRAAIPDASRDLAHQIVTTVVEFW